MTPYAHWLVRLRGDEGWDSWGDRWMPHVDKLADLWWVTFPYKLPGKRVSRQLDWGAWLEEVSPADVLLITPRPNISWLQDGWQLQRRLIDELDPADCYAVIQIEEAEPELGPGVVAIRPTPS
jgi:hypothetical protein